MQKDDILQRNPPAQRDIKSHMTDFRSFLQLVDEEMDTEIDPDHKKKPTLDDEGNPIDEDDELDEDDDDEEDEEDDEEETA